MDEIAAAHPAGVILREKDLSESEYQALAEKVLAICETHHVPCILHSFVHTAIELQATAIHLPLPILREMTEVEKAHFSKLGASCHSAEDALEAEKLGCTYITAGHIFATDCKQGVPPRGLDFLRSVCGSVSIPVYAIGGISTETITSVRAAGAAGACVMSGVMRCEDVDSYIKTFEKAGEVSEVLP